MERAGSQPAHHESEAMGQCTSPSPLTRGAIDDWSILW